MAPIGNSPVFRILKPALCIFWRHDAVRRMKIKHLLGSFRNSDSYSTKAQRPLDMAFRDCDGLSHGKRSFTDDEAIS